MKCDIRVATTNHHILPNGFSFTFTGHDCELEEDFEVTLRFDDSSWLLDLAERLKWVASEQVFRTEKVRSQLHKLYASF